jgi:hypothetical protein
MGERFNKVGTPVPDDVADLGDDGVFDGDEAPPRSHGVGVPAVEQVVVEWVGCPGSWR